MTRSCLPIPRALREDGSFPVRESHIDNVYYSTIDGRGSNDDLHHRRDQRVRRQTQSQSHAPVSGRATDGRTRANDTTTTEDDARPMRAKNSKGSMLFDTLRALKCTSHAVADNASDGVASYQNLDNSRSRQQLSDRRLRSVDPTAQDYRQGSVQQQQQPQYLDPYSQSSAYDRQQLRTAQPDANFDDCSQTEAETEPDHIYEQQRSVGLAPYNANKDVDSMFASLQSQRQTTNLAELLQDDQFRNATTVKHGDATLDTHNQTMMTEVSADTDTHFSFDARFLDETDGSIGTDKDGLAGAHPTDCADDSTASRHDVEDTASIENDPNIAILCAGSMRQLNLKSDNGNYDDCNGNNDNDIEMSNTANRTGGSDPVRAVDDSYVGVAQSIRSKPIQLPDDCVAFSHSPSQVPQPVLQDESTGFDLNVPIPNASPSSRPLTLAHPSSGMPSGQPNFFDGNSEFDRPVYISSIEEHAPVTSSHASMMEGNQRPITAYEHKHGPAGMHEDETPLRSNRHTPRELPSPSQSDCSHSTFCSSAVASSQPGRADEHYTGTSMSRAPHRQLQTPSSHSALQTSLELAPDDASITIGCQEHRANSKFKTDTRHQYQQRPNHIVTTSLESSSWSTISSFTVETAAKKQDCIAKQQEQELEEWIHGPQTSYLRQTYNSAQDFEQQQEGHKQFKQLHSRDRGGAENNSSSSRSRNSTGRPVSSALSTSTGSHTTRTKFSQMGRSLSSCITNGAVTHGFFWRSRPAQVVSCQCKRCLQNRVAEQFRKNHHHRGHSGGGTDPQTIRRLGSTGSAASSTDAPFCPYEHQKRQTAKVALTT